MQNNIQVLYTVMDEVATLQHETQQDKTDTFNLIIDTLGGYPKPRQKGDVVEPHTNVLGAYLCVSNVRNACRLYLLGVNNYNTTIQTIEQNNEIALGLLLAM